MGAFSMLDTLIQDYSENPTEYMRLKRELDEWLHERRNKISDKAMEIWLEFEEYKRRSYGK